MIPRGFPANLSTIHAPTHSDPAIATGGAIGAGSPASGRGGPSLNGQSESMRNFASMLAPSAQQLRDKTRPSSAEPDFSANHNRDTTGDAMSPVPSDPVLASEESGSHDRPAVPERSQIAADDQSGSADGKMPAPHPPHQSASQPALGGQQATSIIEQSAGNPESDEPNPFSAIESVAHGITPHPESSEIGTAGQPESELLAKNRYPNSQSELEHVRNDGAVKESTTRAGTRSVYPAVTSIRNDQAQSDPPATSVQTPSTSERSDQVLVGAKVNLTPNNEQTAQAAETNTQGSTDSKAREAAQATSFTGERDSEADHSASSGRNDSSSGQHAKSETEPATNPELKIHSRESSRRSETLESVQPQSTDRSVPQSLGHEATSSLRTETEPGLDRAAFARSFKASNSSGLAVSSDEQITARSVARGLNAVLRQGGGSVTMKLSPASLGEIRIEMIMQSGRVSVQFDVGSLAAYDAVKGHMSELRQSLEQRGMTVERVETHLSPALARPAPVESGSQGRSADYQNSSDRQDAQHDAGDGASRGRTDGEEHHSASRESTWSQTVSEDSSGFEQFLQIGIDATA